MTIEQLQNEIDQWIHEHGVRYFDELTNLGVLMEEVGELSRHLVRQFGEQSYKEGKRPSELKDALSEEMGDVMFVLICLANQMGIDLTVVMTANLAKKTRRDNTRHSSNDKLS